MELIFQCPPQCHRTNRRISCALDCIHEWGGHPQVQAIEQQQYARLAQARPEWPLCPIVASNGRRVAGKPIRAPPTDQIDMDCGIPFARRKLRCLLAYAAYVVSTSNTACRQRLIQFRCNIQPFSTQTRSPTSQAYQSARIMHVGLFSTVSGCWAGFQHQL